MKQINYEAWYKNEQIYNGTSKNELINELYEFVRDRKHLPCTSITKEDIEQLNERALEKLGITLYYAYW